MNIENCLTTGSSIVASTSLIRPIAADDASQLLKPEAAVTNGFCHHQHHDTNSLKTKINDDSAYLDQCSPAKRSRPQIEVSSSDAATPTPVTDQIVESSLSNQSSSTLSFESTSSSIASSSSSLEDQPITGTTSVSVSTSQSITITTATTSALPSSSTSANEIQSPRQLLSHLLPSVDLNKLPPNIDDFDICRLLYTIMSSNESDQAATANIDFDSIELPTNMTALNHASALSSLFLTPREKLYDINTIEECVDLIYKSNNIIVLTGAGCSVSCGIPDFRSRDGIYARLRVDFPDLPDPQSMFDIHYFEHDPRPFFKFAKEIYPGQFRPSVSHKFVKKLEQHKKLLRNYTQNIDTLEQVASIQNVIQCHGSFNTATCTVCKFQVGCEYIKDKIFRQEIPYCDKCTGVEVQSELTDDGDEDTEVTTIKQGILKPDIVFFGEGLPEIYHTSVNEDKNKCDLLIVIGSSLKVKPVANIPHMLPKNIPQILINRESLKHMSFDVELLGDCDVIVQELLHRLELKRIQELDKSTPETAKSKEAEPNEINQIEWSDVCTVKTMLSKIENEEAEQIIFNNHLAQSAPIIHQKVDREESDEDDEENEENEKKNVETKTEQQETENGNQIQESNCSEVASADAKPSNSEAAYTRDYLKENSFIYLRPNIYVFHGAELSLKGAKRKLKRLRRKYNSHMKSVNGELIAMNEDSEDEDSISQAKVSANGEGGSSAGGAAELVTCLSQLYKDRNTNDGGLEDDEDDDSFDSEEDDFSSDEDSDDDDEENDDDDDDDDEEEQPTPAAAESTEQLSGE